MDYEEYSTRGEELRLALERLFIEYFTAKYNCEPHLVRAVTDQYSIEVGHYGPTTEFETFVADAIGLDHSFGMF